MISIPFISNLYSKAKEKNTLTGILFFDVIALLSYVLNPISILFFGDLDLTFGAIVGLLFAFKNRKENQTHLKIALHVGLFGAILSAVSITIYQWILIIVFVEFNFMTFWPLLLSFSILAVVIGGILSIIIGYYYFIKDRRISRRISNDKYNDDYLEDLLKK